jgi:hypothetical protein
VIDLETTPRRAQAHEVVVVPDGTLSIETESGPIVLNATAAALWQLCDGETSVQEMIQAAGELFDSGPDIVRHDILAILQDFEARGLVS